MKIETARLVVLEVIVGTEAAIAEVKAIEETVEAKATSKTDTSTTERRRSSERSRLLPTTALPIQPS